MKKKLPIYEINIDYACIVNNEKLVSLISFVDNDILQFLLKRKESIFYNENSTLRIVPNINDINNEIEIQLDNNNIPKKILFIYDNNDYNENYIYIKEIFSGVTIKVDKILVSFFKINRLKANYKLLNYNLEQIINIENLMANVAKELKKSKIIDFPLKRIKER